MIQKQLRGIVRKISSVPLKIETIRMVNENHEKWCKTWDWTKEDGQYAKGLENWLAPTMGRWQNAPREEPLDDGIESAKDYLAREAARYAAQQGD